MLILTTDGRTRARGTIAIGIKTPARTDPPPQPEGLVMNLSKRAPLTAALALSLAAAVPAGAQNAPTGPWVQMQTTSTMIGIGGQSGEGQLTLPNLGTNCVYPFTVSGFGVGIQVGISRVSAAGPVSNLSAVEQFQG